jgi:hypothetical protein
MLRGGSAVAMRKTFLRSLKDGTVHYSFREIKLSGFSTKRSRLLDDKGVWVSTESPWVVKGVSMPHLYLPTTDKYFSYNHCVPAFDPADMTKYRNAGVIHRSLTGGIPYS